jgi:SOUL heme-binding protein
MSNSVAFFAEAAIAVFGIRSQYEQPKYEVIERLQNSVEIRRYAPRVAAEVTVSAVDERKGRNEAFGILANYIFGANARKADIAMTAPVETGKTASQQISMTAPVEMNASARGRFTMRFFLPTSLTIETAPKPNDSRVTIVQMPQETIAALTFSGSAGYEVVEEYNRELGRALSASGWRAQGQPFTLFYDPPFTIPFLRRNEVALRVTPN